MAGVDLGKYSLKDRLKGSTAYTALQKDVIAPAVSADPYTDVADAVKFAEDSEAQKHIGELTTYHGRKQGSVGVDAEAKISPGLQAEITGKGKNAQSALDKLAEHGTQAGEDIQNMHKAAQAEIIADVQTGKISADEGKRLRDALAKERDAVAKFHSDAGAFVEHHRTEVHKMSDVQSKGVKFGAVGKAVEVTKDAAGKRAPIGAEAFAKKNVVGKWMESTKQALSHGGKIKTAFRVAGASVGAIIMLKGVKDITTRSKDENGQEIPGAGGLIKGISEVGLGGGALLFSLAKGGGKLARGV